MHQNKILILFVFIVSLTAVDPINEDQYQWYLITGQQAIQALTQSNLFQLVNAQAKSFWYIYQNQQLSTINKIQQLFTKKIHYFRITYQSTRNDRPQYDQVIITVRVAFYEKRKFMVTRSIPPVSVAHNVQGYVSDY